MIVATDRCCAAPLLTFLQTLFEIALLRKGPEHIPRSFVLLLMAILFWLLAVLLSMAVLFGLNAQRFGLEVSLLLFGLACYSAMLVLSGKRERIMQTLAGVLGAGAVTVLVFVVVTFIFLVLFGRTGIQFAVSGFMIWSVSVKGHIIASALDRQWFVGAILASVVLVLQLAIGNVFHVNS